MSPERKVFFRHEWRDFQNAIDDAEHPNGLKDGFTRRVNVDYLIKAMSIIKRYEHILDNVASIELLDKSGNIIKITPDKLDSYLFSEVKRDSL